MKSRGSTLPRRRRDRILVGLGHELLRRRSVGGQRAGPRPLFIIGSGRSGNTLARRVLMASGGIYIPPETFVVGDIIDGWSRAWLLSWREKVWLFCAHFEKHAHFADFGLENLNAFAQEATLLPERSLRALFDAFYRHLARAHGSESLRWGDKTPYNTFHLSALRAVFPDAQYLWLVRDGRDAALSYVDAGLFDDLGAAANRWTAANTACQSLAASNADVYRQNYESMVSDPAAEFAGICAWAGLPFDPGMLTAPTGKLGDVEAHAHHGNVTRPITNASAGRWRTRLSAETLATLPTGFWDMMGQLGYDADTL